MEKRNLKQSYLLFFALLFYAGNAYSSVGKIETDTIVIQNDFLIVKIKKRGAEIISIYNKKNSIEHIWQADKKSWNQNAPILFPIVGKLKNKQYFIDNKSYKMKNHGFASYLDFKVISKTNKKIVLELVNNKNTLKEYPFKFKLQVKYCLQNQKVSIDKTVENTDNKDMFFSIGAHPGFNIPLHKGEKFSDYYLEFSKNETADRLPLTKEEGLLSNTRVFKYLNNARIMPLNHNMFKDRVVILEGLKSSKVTLKSKNSKSAITVGIKNFPFLGIWTTSKSNMPFVCIEPWHGISDNINTNGNFKEKKGIQKLGVGKKFKMKYFIKIDTK